MGQPFRIYNTLSRSLEDFKPIQAGKIGLYVRELNGKTWLTDVQSLGCPSYTTGIRHRHPFRIRYPIA